MQTDLDLRKEVRAGERLWVHHHTETEATLLFGTCLAIQLIKYSVLFP